MRSHVLAHIPGATLEVVPGSGHLLPLERPDELSARIAAFRHEQGSAAQPLRCATTASVVITSAYFCAMSKRLACVHGGLRS